MHVREIKDLYERIIEDNPDNEVDAIIEGLISNSLIKQQIMKSAISSKEEIKLISLLTRFLEKKIASFDSVKKDPRFREYCRDYHRNIRDYQISSQEELWQAVDSAGVISVADFHFVNEPKFFLLRLLEHLLKQNRTVTIGLEPILESEQTALNKYLAGTNGHSGFAQSIEKYRNDHLSFEFDRIIFEFLKEHKTRIKTIGIDSQGHYSTRDRHASIIIAREKESHPEVPVVVFGGDLHFAQSHLPAEIARKTDAQQLIIYQNIPKIFYDLLKKRHNPEDTIVKCNSQGFCVTSLNPLELVIAHFDYKNTDFDEIGPETPVNLETPTDSYHEKAEALLRLTYALRNVPLKDLVLSFKELYTGTRVLKEAERAA